VSGNQEHTTAGWHIGAPAFPVGKKRTKQHEDESETAISKENKQEKGPNEPREPHEDGFTGSDLTLELPLELIDPA
jgi:hypothetical protein